MAKKPNRGQPRKLDDAKKKKYLQFISSGKRGAMAAAAGVGVTNQTILNERRRDPEFRDAIKRAKGERLGKLEEMAFAMAPEEPKVLMFLLASLCPEVYAKRREERPIINNAPTVVITDPEAVRSRLAKLASDIGVEGVVDAVRVEHAGGDHPAIGFGSAAGSP